jgi:KDO2-lipid IV(A) lauroyltransferase
VKQIGAYIFIASSWLLSKSPEFILYRFADFLYIILYYIIGYRKKVVFKNLRNSFPDKSDKEISNIAKKFFHHLSDTFIENIAIITMSKKRILKLVKIEDEDIAKKLYKKNKNIIGVTGHYCNWETCLVLPLLSQHQVLGVYKPLNNRLFNKLFYNMRAKFGAIPVTMNDTYKTVLEYRKNNKLTFLGLIADQRPQKQAGNYWTSFLNQDTVVFLGPEKFAKKLNAAVIFVYLEKIKRGRYILKTKLLFEDVANCKDFEITETYLRFLEKMIIDKPEYWLWSHNRWKHKRKKE